MLGHEILGGLPTMQNEAFFQMYEAMDQWMKGDDVNLYWEKKATNGTS